MNKWLLGLCLCTLAPAAAQASTAYGSLSNFDAVNDTGVETHGFEIEIDDVHSTAVQYTYDWNHYGTPSITEDNSDPAHPKTFVRYQSKKDAAGNYLSYTAVPNGPFAPTQGHQCTNPAVNEGCEHFGVSYSAPGAVKYHWLIDDPAAPGNLVLGPEVLIAAPSWTYQPAAPAVPAKVVAVIPAPPVPVPPAKQFGNPSWVKVIKTKLHNKNKIPLDDLVSADNNGDGKADWANGEVAQVETEWYLLQTNSAGKAGKLKLPGAGEALKKGDEVVTRRYEFYKYAGSAASLDGENGEAMCDQVAKDKIHGVGAVEVTDANGDSYLFNCGTDVVVGDYTGAQMVGFDAAAALGLIEHIEDGAFGTAYTKRRVVVGGNTPYVTKVTGALPKGLKIASTTGVLSGTPTEVGIFDFSVAATDANNAAATKAYTIHIAGCTQYYVRIKTVGPDFLVVNNGLAPADSVWYTPTLAATKFLGGTTTFLAGEYVSFTGAVDDTGACHAATMTVNPKVIYNVADAGQGTITAVGAHFVKIGAKKILWNSNTAYTLNAAAITPGMNAVWKGKLSAATNTVLATKLTIN